MHLQTRPKLYPPMALLFSGPSPGPTPVTAATERRSQGPSSNLSVNELRRILAKMLD